MEGKVGVGGGGEIRRVHIVYFLSRMGRVEHPHLIRVHHLSKNGVHLRDVKRWLSELRGKDMPDSFAWSYKRRYKTGYVWQDLLDDDLITPISDNEYVIKGSEITTISIDPCFRGEKKGSTLTKAETIASIEETKSKTSDFKSNAVSHGEDSGPLDSETSESNGSIKERNSDDDHQKQRIIVPNTEIEELNIDETQNCSRKNEKDEIPEKQTSSSSPSTTSTTRSSTSSSSSSSSFNKSKSCSSGGGGATHVFRSLLSCRATDINDSALMMINRCSSSSSDICKFENLGGGSDMSSSGILWNNQHQTRRSVSKPSSENSTSKKSNEFASGHQKKVSAAFKPVAEPHCSQCGKGFKPERLHSHMKSCRGLKSLSKNRNSATVGYDFEADQKFSTPFGSFKERNQQGCF